MSKEGAPIRAVTADVKKGKEIPGAHLKIARILSPRKFSDPLAKIIGIVIKEIGATAMADMGKVMGVVMSKVGGAADGGRVSKMVSEKLQQK